ncbi:hypothetical protein ACX0G9_20185 [Flavitalea flava]
MRSLLLLTAFMASRILSNDNNPNQSVVHSCKSVVLSSRSAQSFIDPTGTYVLMGVIKKNKVIGHSGEIRVQLLETNKVAVCFYINKGYPDYASGFFTDTLPYNENQVHYTPPATPDCTIVLDFQIRSVEIMQVYSDPHCRCGFKEGVLVSTTFQKSSSERPVIQDMALHRI